MQSRVLLKSSAPDHCAIRTSSLSLTTSAALVWRRRTWRRPGRDRSTSSIRLGSAPAAVRAKSIPLWLTGERCRDAVYFVLAHWEKFWAVLGENRFWRVFLVPLVSPWRGKDCGFNVIVPLQIVVNSGGKPYQLIDRKSASNFVNSCCFYPSPTTGFINPPVGN